MDRSAKKAVAHQGKDDITQGVSMTHLSRVWNHASLSEEMGQWFALAGNLQMEAY